MAKEQGPKTCRNCERWKEVKRQMAVAGILGKAVTQFEKKLLQKDFSPTLAEFLKLVQMEQELENDLNPPEEIQVKWVEPKSESES